MTGIDIACKVCKENSQLENSIMNHMQSKAVYVVVDDGAVVFSC